ncbi:MAG: hypothetical protein ABW042_04145 [Phenylobacterium sp.]
MAPPSEPGRRIGIDLPWSVAWSGEQAFRLRPSTLFPGYAEVDQREAPGQGEPLFAAVHVTRQRRAMAGFLCHVCGEPTAASDRWIFTVASGGMVDLGDGTQRYGCNVPPVHRRCADRAARLCPHLTRLDERPIRCGPDEGRLVPRTDVVPGMEALAASLPPGPPVVFSCYRLSGEAFTRRAAQARADWEKRTLAHRCRS